VAAIAHRTGPSSVTLHHKRFTAGPERLIPARRDTAAPVCEEQRSRGDPVTDAPDWGRLVAGPRRAGRCYSSGRFSLVITQNFFM
jgi:hypothetical protein